MASNVFSLFASYYVYGRRALSWRQVLLPTAAPAPGAKRPAPEKKEREEEREEPALTAPRPAKARGAHGKRRGKRKDRR